MKNDSRIRCDNCLTEGSILPGLGFTSLEGEPFICELCVANFFGISGAKFKISVEENLFKEKKLAS